MLVDVPCNASGNAEVEQAFDPVTGILYEAWIGCSGIGFSRSTDGGSTFDPAMTVPGSAPAGGSSWDPAIALSPNGTVYVAFMVSVPGDTPVVAWSWDHGQSFPGFADVFVPPGNSFSDRDFIAIAPNGTLYVTWDFSPMVNWPNATPLDVLGCASGGSCYFTHGDYNIVIAWSTDGGRNWSATVPVDPEYPWGGAPCGPLQIAPNGTIEVLFEDYQVSGGDHALGLGYNFFSRSFDGGVTWTMPLRVANASFPNNVWWIDGALTSDPSGTIYATFDSVNSTADTAWVAISRDGGASWPVLLRVNSDQNRAMHSLVEGAGGENGTVYLAWMTNASGNWTTYEATLAGNGTAWGAPVAVSLQPGLPGYWIGDTLGISYLGHGKVAVSWSYGVTQGGLTGSQVFEAVVSEDVPSAPSSVQVLPGHGNATVTWSPPIGVDPVTGYRVDWGIEGGVLPLNATVGPGARSFVIPALLPFARYQLRLTAFNDAGPGVSSPTVNLTLTAWSRFAGTVLPATAWVSLDGTTAPVVLGAYAVNSTFGVHLLSAGHTNYQTQSTAVLPAWNGTVFTNLTLGELPGTLEGFVTPVTAQITWAGTGVPTDNSGFYSVSVPAGAMGALAASYPGRVSQSHNVTMAANTTVWVNVTLVPPNGTLLLEISPVNASALVGGVPAPLDSAGNATLSLAAGTYPVEVTALGYVARYANVTVHAGVPTTLILALNATPGSGEHGTGGASPSNPLLGPFGLLLLVTVVAVALLAVWAGRRWSRRGSPPAEADASPTIDDTVGIEVDDAGDPTSIGRLP